MANSDLDRCDYCDKVFRRRNGKHRFCSDRCREAYANRQDKGCMFRDGVECKFQVCECCGWNPMVEEQRLRKLGVV